MSKIYDIAFRMGVLFNVLLWTVLNIIDFFDARNDFLYWEYRGLKFSHVGDFIWGVPFPMFRESMLWNSRALVLNSVIYVACAFFFGFLFKFVWSKISSRRVELK